MSDIDVVIDNNGGVVPSAPQDLTRAKNAGLVTLPPDIPGKNCSNCVFYANPQGHLAYCSHKKVLQVVSDRNSCNFWSNPGTTRHW